MMDVGGLRVHLAVGSTDLRRGMDGLSLIVMESFKLDPFSKDLYVFCNRARNKIKILQWDDTGFWLYCKRLEKNRFKWPEGKAGTVEIGRRELTWLLSGLSLIQKGAHKEIRARKIC